MVIKLNDLEKTVFAFFVLCPYRVIVGFDFHFKVTLASKAHMI